MERRSFTLVELMIVMAIIAITAAIAIPNLLSARKNANESATIGSLKAISNAQTLYREGDKDADNTTQYAPTMVSLSDVGPASEDLIDDVLASGTKQGYTYAMTVPGPPTNLVVWSVNANPVVPGTTGDRHFGANMAGLIFFNATAPVTFDALGRSNDPVIGH